MYMRAVYIITAINSWNVLILIQIFYEDARSSTKMFLSLHSGKVRIWF